MMGVEELDDVDAAGAAVLSVTEVVVVGITTQAAWLVAPSSPVH